MKIGICLSPANLAKLKKGSADYVELPLSTLSTLDDAALTEIEANLTRLGIKAETSNGFYPETVRLCGKDYSPAKVEEYCRMALPKAARLGITTCVLGSSCSRNIPDGEDRAACIRQLEESFSLTATVAAEYGITVAIEPLNRAESNVLNSVAEGADFSRRVANPNLLLLADFFHVTKENEPMENIVKNADLLRHVHIARPVDRTAPLPDDGYDYAEMAKALRDAHYDARVSIEGRVDGDYAETAEKALTYLKTIFN